MSKKVILVHPGGAEIPFDEKAADKLMSMPNNGGWKRKAPQDTPKRKAKIKKAKDINNGVGNNGDTTEAKGADQ